MPNEISQYVQSQRAKGIQDGEIGKALISAGWDKKAVDSALAPQAQIDTPPAPPTPPPTNSPIAATSTNTASSHLNASQLLLVIGALLVVIATIVIITNSWSALSPLLRFMAIAVPNTLLFAISFFVKDRENLGHVKDGTNATGLLLLPATIGVFLYQFGIYTNVDAFLLFLSVVGALPICLFFDFYRKQHYATVLGVVFILASFIFLGTHLEINLSEWLVSSCLIGTVFFGLARWVLLKDDARSQLYRTTSATILLFAVPALISDIIGFWHSNIWAQSQFDMETKTVILCLSVGITGLVLGSLYTLVFKPNSRNDYMIQRAFQLQAMLGLFGPLLFLVSSNGAYLMLALVLSGIIVLLGMFVGVNLLFIAGIVGLIVNLLFFLLQQIDINQVISLLLLGFLSIGLSIVLGKIKTAKKVLFSSALAARLGFISDDEAQALSLAEQGGRAPRKMSGCLIIALVLLGLWLLPGLFFSLVSRPFTTSSEFDPPVEIVAPNPTIATDPDPVAIPETTTGYAIYTSINPAYTLQYPNSWRVDRGFSAVAFSFASTNSQGENRVRVLTERDPGTLGQEAFFSQQRDFYGFTNPVVTDLEIMGVPARQFTGQTSSTYQQTSTTIVVWRKAGYSFVGDFFNSADFVSQQEFLTLLKSIE